jgi:Na+-driven multidrug efflux pump
MAASFSVANLFFVAFGGIYSATGVVLGRTLGEGDLEKARQQKTWLLSGSAVFGVFMMLFGFATTLLIPIIYGRLSESAIEICRSMVILMSFFMPAWVYLNAQQAVARAGGDTAMGAITDSGITIFIMLPLLFMIGFLTDTGPVLLYLYVKLLDILKIIVFHIWLKKERWLRNLTISKAAT